MAGDLTHGIPTGRLVLTRSRRMWHVSGGEVYTLCQARISTYRLAHGPISTAICARCRQAYRREVSDV